MFAPPAVKINEPPLQTVGIGGVTVTMGIGFTVTVTDPVFTQLLFPVAVMVYVVVVVGLAVTFAPAVADNPVAGDHA